MADDLLEQFQGLMDNPDIGARLRGLMPDGFDPSKLLDILKGDPDLMAKVKELLPDVDIEGALSGLAGAAAGAAAQRVMRPATRPERPRTRAAASSTR